MNLVVNEITGYACYDEVIDIKNHNGKGLYFMNNPEKKRVTFNLIPSKGSGWVTENKLVKLNTPLEYILPDLPKPKLDRKLKPFKIVVQDNPNKCTVDFEPSDHVLIIIDPEIDNQAIPFVTFVLFHEQGHFYWGNETKGTKAYDIAENNCDTFACYNMLKRGFNPSQCIFAIELCLSEFGNSRWRKDKIFNWLKKVKVR